ncbi:MAG: phage antirepressor KilAC domain-containing protein [Plesiomonas shigelloides]
MSSVDLAKLCVGDSKDSHYNFMRKAEKVLGSDAFVKFHERETYGNGNGRTILMLPEREACLMAMSYSYELQAKVYDAWHELKSKSVALLPDFNDPIAAARAWADAKEQALIAEKQLAIAAPKAEFVDKFVESSGLFGFRQVAKTLGVKENWLREFLQEQKIMYYLKGKLTAYANHIDAGRFQSRVGVADNGHNFNECKFTAKGVEWIAALIAVEKVKAQ